VGKNIIQLPVGRYSYQYTACSIESSGKLDLPSGKALRIRPCKTTRIVIKNYTLTESPGTGLTLRLAGPVNYYFVLTQPSEKLTVQQGTYKYTLRGCGKLIGSDTIKFDTAQYRWSIHCLP
jgi:hypothetical protein